MTRTGFTCITLIVMIVMKFTRIEIIDCIQRFRQHLSWTFGDLQQADSELLDERRGNVTVTHTTNPTKQVIACSV